MGKYIIEVGDAYVLHALGRKLIMPVIINNDKEYWVNTNIQLTPYTEPDTEKVREEVLEAVSKIYDIPQEDRGGIFPKATFYVSDIVQKYSASEIIEKIRQYEQEKEGQIQVGDEVENTQTGVKFIVTHLWKNNRGEQGVSGFNQECSAFSTTLSLVVKTGRHFPEIAEVLEKMRGE